MKITKEHSNNSHTIQKCHFSCSSHLDLVILMQRSYNLRYCLLIKGVPFHRVQIYSVISKIILCCVSLIRMWSLIWSFCNDTSRKMCLKILYTSHKHNFRSWKCSYYSYAFGSRVSHCSLRALHSITKYTPPMHVCDNIFP